MVRFDNRDAGLSTQLDGLVDLDAVAAAAAQADHRAAEAAAAYSLADMAADVVGLLDVLGVDRAHVLGASMGGMIAQLVALDHPDRVLTLTSIMSSTGESGYGAPTPEAEAALLSPSPSDRDGYVRAAVASARIWSSRRWFDPAERADLARRSYDRSFAPDGVARQLAALVAAGPRGARLAGLDRPTLVVHGLDDTLITPSGGERTAEVVPGAHLLLVPDMGHDRPRPLWPLLCDAILDHTAPGTG